MPHGKVAPYGSWQSPLTADLVASRAAETEVPGWGFGDLFLDGEDLYWMEGRPQEEGRCVVMRLARDGAKQELTPPPFNVRSRVHEYGGAAYTVDDGTVFFSNFQDQRLYRQAPGAQPVPITPEGPFRYADGVLDRARRRLICIREDHTQPGAQPENCLVGIDLAGANPPQVLVSGNDFYAAPRLSPDGSRLAWIAWDHPNMPFYADELWVGRVADDGAIAGPQRLAGGPAESVYAPRWSPDGALYFVSDAGGWWNLWRWRDGRAEPVCHMPADVAWMPWLLGASPYDFESADRIVLGAMRGGTWDLHVVEPGPDMLDLIWLPYTDIWSLRAAPGRVVFAAGSPAEAPCIVQVDLATYDVRVLHRSGDAGVDPSYISRPQAIEYPTQHGRTAHAFFYPPHNPDYAAPAHERPPLLVIGHGGPTMSTWTTSRWDIQYWTSRGIAVLDLNYSGSTGFGREYRMRLLGQWGVVDVDDGVNGARYLVEQGVVDPDRLAIRGESAGGYLALAALTFRDCFKAGASYYGIGDLERLAQETHKFESHYLDSLVGPYPECRDLYRRRSPIEHVDRLSGAIIFFQGLEDRVVPPDQAERMVEALRAKGLKVAYLTFENEGHGFRRSETIKCCLNAELEFYAQVFGFDRSSAQSSLRGSAAAILDSSLRGSAATEATSTSAEGDCFTSLAMTVEGAQTEATSTSKEGHTMTHNSSAIDLAEMGKVLSVDDQLCFARPYDISPDGTKVAFTWNASGNWEIYVVRLAGGAPQRLTFGPGNKYYPRWSPHGDRIAYLYDADGSENFDIYLVSESGGEPTPLVEWPGVAERFVQWSPGGDQIAFESNKDGNFDVWLVSSSGGEPRRLTDLASTYKVPEWSPDGHQIAFTGRGADGPTDLDVFVVPVAGGEARPIIRIAAGSLDRSPAWSPDGKWIAFTTDAFGKDDVGLYAVDGGEITWIGDPRWEVITPGPIFGTSAVAWSPDGTKVAYALNRAGNVDLVVRDLYTGSETVFNTPPGQRLYPAFAADGKHVMFVYDGPRHPPDLWVGSIEDGAAIQLTESLVGAVSRASLVEPELVWWPSFDGRRISGFLYTPEHRAQGSPALLWVHGGPTWQYRNIWDPVVQFLVSRGYLVLAPNIRGSTGSGKEFRELAIGDWGGGDLKDLVAGAEYLERRGVAGRGRIGIAGASYGGYMTLMAMTKTPERWAAGVSIVGIVNLHTLYTTTRGDLQFYLIQQLGTPEDHPELYWDRSPLNFADDVKNPLMIVQGGTDPRVPLDEAEQMARALQARGAILEYKVYPDEGHDIMKLENKLDCYASMADFLDKHMVG